MPEQPSEPRDLADGVEPTEFLLHDEPDAQLIRRLADRARSEGLALTGTGGLLQQLTKLVLESALEGGCAARLSPGECRPGRRASNFTEQGLGEQRTREHRYGVQFAEQGVGGCGGLRFDAAAHGRREQCRIGASVSDSIGWLMHHRLLARDYERHPHRSEAMIHLAMTDLMARRLTREATPNWRGT